MGRNENGLFGQVVDYYQYCSVSLQCQKLFDEVHRNGFPWVWGDWQFFEEAIQFVLVCLGACTYCAGSDVLFDHLSKSGPMVCSCFPYVLASGLLPSSDIIPHGEEAW